MKNENIIVALIFLVIVALFAFNFSKMTGFAPKSLTKPTVTISPTNIKAGVPLNVIIKINDYCVDEEFKIYPIRDNIIGTRKARKVYSPDIGDCARISSKGSKIPCGSNKYCKNNLKEDKIKTTIDTSSNWVPGKYILRVYYYEKPGQEKSEDKAVDTEFKIS